MANRKTHPFNQLVSDGHITEHEHKQILAHNHGAGAIESTIWGGGGVYNWPTAAEPITLFSASPSDANGNVGAHAVTLIGLDANYNPISEVVVMNGTANVITSNSFLRINEAYVSNVGTFQYNVGNITGVHANTLSGTPGSSVTSGNVLHIRANTNTYESAAWTVPANVTAYMYTFLGSSAKAGETEINFYYKDDGLPWRVKCRLEVNSSMAQIKHDFPLVFTEKTDVDVRCEASAPNTSVETIVTFLLVNN